MGKERTVIISIAPFGNAVSNYFYELARYFVQQKFKVIIIFYNKPEISLKEEEGILFYVWPSKRPTNIIDFVFFIKLLLKYKTEMVFSNFSSTNVIGIVSYLFRIKKRFNYLHTTPAQLSIDATISKNRQNYLNFRKSLIYKTYTHFLANSTGTKNSFIANFGLRGEKIQVCPLLIKDSTFRYIPIEHRKKQILILGRLDKSKGHLELLKCFQLLIQEDSDYKLLIAGSGKQRDILDKYVSENGLCKSVVFLGKIPYDEVGRYLSESLIHVSSSYEEAFGLVNIESLREGTPILCTVTSGSKDILLPNYNGEFFDINLPGTFVNTVKQIEKKWGSYSTGARLSYQENYSIGNIENHFKNIVEA